MIGRRRFAVFVSVLALSLLAGAYRIQETCADPCSSGTVGQTVPGEVVVKKAWNPEISQPDNLDPGNCLGAGTYRYKAVGGYPPYTWSVSGGTSAQIDPETGDLTVGSDSCGTVAVNVTDTHGFTSTIDTCIDQNSRWEVVSSVTCCNSASAWRDCITDGVWYHYGWTDMDECPVCKGLPCPCPGIEGYCPGSNQKVSFITTRVRVCK